MTDFEPAPPPESITGAGTGAGADADPMDVSGAPVPAGWWRRGKALIIDVLIWFAAELIPAAMAVVGLAFALDAGSDDSVVAVGWVLFGIGALASLAVAVWAGWKFGWRQGVTGTTPGKRRLGIRLIDIGTGQAPGGARGLGRWLVPGLIDSVANVYSLIDLLWPIWDDRNQRVTDKMFKTQVVEA